MKRKAGRKKQNGSTRWRNEKRQAREIWGGRKLTGNGRLVTGDGEKKNGQPGKKGGRKADRKWENSSTRWRNEDRQAREIGGEESWQEKGEWQQEMEK